MTEKHYKLMQAQVRVYGNMRRADALKLFEAYDALVAERDRLREALNDIACWDIGSMNDYGGGNVFWWHDYIRSEIGGIQQRANDALGEAP